MFQLCQPFTSRGVDNWAADLLSRETVNPGEWSLHPTVFLQICQRLGSSDMDLFASSLNHKLPLFVSRAHDPRALTADVLITP